jgi:hypothetical protein
MTVLSRFFCSFLMLLCGMSTVLHAHTRSETHSSWQITGAKIHLQFTIPDLESRRITTDGDLPSVEQLGRYIAAHVGALAGDQPCETTEGPRPISATAGYRRYEFLFECADVVNISVHSSVLFELVASHTTFAQIQNENGMFVEQLITKERRTVAASDSDESPLQGAGFLEFVQMGIMHIFTGIDHMSFMLGLVLISRRVRDLLFVVTGFTIGHSLTLALAVTGTLRPEPQFIDALVALTIVLIGCENVGDSTHKPLPVALGLSGILLAMALTKSLGGPVALPTTLLIGGGLFAASYLLMTGHMRDAARVRMIVTLVFGLIHGFGFASDLIEMRLPAGRLAELLVGFNVGVEVGQVAVVLGALLVAYLLVKIRLGVPRPILTDVAASLLVGGGLYWFLGRAMIAS